MGTGINKGVRVCNPSRVTSRSQPRQSRPRPSPLASTSVSMTATPIMTSSVREHSAASTVDTLPATRGFTIVWNTWGDVRGRGSV